jgi:hypothetical protein
LSYLWGECKDGINYNEQGEFASLTPLGRKALTKAVKALKKVNKDWEENINLLWVDQLCINQDKSEESKKDKEKEIPKMRKYYSNATITLISIDDKVGDLSNVDLIDILGKTVNSEWFTRSWTYQEGWLSKHTIFMFDDKLIDGWAMAGTWALNQLGYANEGRYNSRAEFNKGTKKIATPVGWTYYRDGYDESEKIEMTLGQVLKEIKNRGRSVPVDGIYSILGLLPYGDKVVPKYKNWGEIYTKKDVEKALKEVMKIAIKNGYAEPLAWHGVGNWVPEIVFNEWPEGKKWEELSSKEKEMQQKNGSTSVVGGMDIKLKVDEEELKEYVEEGIKIMRDAPLFGFEEEKIILQLTNICKIKEAVSDIHKLEGGFEIESGLYRKEVEVEKQSVSSNKIIKVPLLGTEETLELVEEGKFLAIFDREIWQSNKPFALLIEDTGKTCYDEPVYHRLGLVELGDERLQQGDFCPDLLIIGNNSSNQTELKLEYKAQVEIPPK